MFSAEWCSSCSIIQPTFESMKDTYEKKNKVKFSYIDIDEDEHSELCEHYEVNKIPLVIVLKNGSEVERHTGSDVLKLRAMLIKVCENEDEGENDF